MFKYLIHTPQDSKLTLARLALGLVILPHGAQKLLGWFGGSGFDGTMGYFTEAMGIPAPLAFLVIIAEFFGALALIFGALARPASAAIGAIMVVAALMVHLPNGFFMNWSGAQGGEGFEFHILATALALVVTIGGAGALSLDRRLALSLTDSDSPADIQAAEAEEERRRVKTAA